MTRIGDKPEPPFGLDMSFDEALRRFAATVPGEVGKAIAAGKQKSALPLVESDAVQIRKKKPPAGATVGGQDRKVVKKRSDQQRGHERK